MIVFDNVSNKRDTIVIWTDILIYKHRQHLLKCYSNAISLTTTTNLVQ